VEFELNAKQCGDLEFGFSGPVEERGKGYAFLFCRYRYKREGAMGILAFVDLMGFLVVGLFVFSVVTPSGVDARRSRRY
jgi:hypothetical protein